MSKLNDIKGYWDMSYSYTFNENNMWEGQMLLDDDGWFEGIVVDPNSSYKEDRFIFGVYYPTKVIELYKLTPIDVSTPFVFYGNRDAKGYDGQFETIGLLGPTPCGVSHIITQDAETVRGNVETEIEKLKAKIERYKSQIMDADGKSFYENFIAIRNSMCEITLRNYEGIGFTPGEYQQIMQECQPINDRVYQATVEEVRRLVKETPKNIPDDDGSLPF